MFLATTAIEEFWDKSDKILFLGEWCKLYSRRAECSRLDYEDFEFSWDRQKVVQAYSYCNTIYEKLLAALTDSLNSIHFINKNKEYYRIILGNWLIHFIHHSYEKYTILKAVFDKYPDLTTFILDKSQYYIPLEYNDFIGMVKDDRYHLQLYSQILKGLGREFESRELGSPIVNKETHHINNTLKDKLDSMFAITQTAISSLFNSRATVSMTKPYLSNAEKALFLPLLAKSGFKYIFDDMRYSIKIRCRANLDFRNGIRLEFHSDEFERVLSEVIFKNVPLVYIEGFKEFNAKVSALPIKRSRIFFTANAAHSNSIYKFFIAQRHNELKVLTMQHGAGYGTQQASIMEEYERSTCDIFYTWGWSYNEKTRNLPHPKIKRYKMQPQEKLVLFTAIRYQRYLYRFAFEPNELMGVNYIDWAIIFLKNLRRDTRLLIRLHSTDDPQQCSVRQRMRDAGINFEFDDLSCRFKQRLNNCYICVTDSLSTASLEALGGNKPTVIYVNPQITAFRDSARPYFEKLSRAKILHYSPHSAAEHLNSVYDDVGKWWDTAQVQDARQEFVNTYAKGSDNWMEEWLQEFERVLAGC